MRLKTLVLACFVSFPGWAGEIPAPAPTGSYVADTAHTSVLWRIGHFGLSNYTARFTRFAADLTWNPEAPSRSKLSVSIDPTSVKTDFPFPEKEDFDRKIGQDPSFLAGQPIAFVSTNVEITGERSGKIIGDLTFRGQTHPATLDVTFNGSMARHPMDKVAKVGFSAKGKLLRSEWGLDFAQGALSDEVEVVIEAEFMAPREN